MDSGKLKKGSTQLTEKQLERLKECVAMTRYGSVTLTIHNGKVVAMEKNEKYRFEE